MLWFFLLLALLLILLASTNRLEAIDEEAGKFFRKLRLAWEYAREDVDDVEFDIREEARARQAAETPASGDPADAAPAQPRE